MVPSGARPSAKPLPHTQKHLAACCQQRQRVPLLRRDVRFVHPFAQAVVHRSPGGAVNIPRLAGAQNKTSIQRSYSSIIRPIF